MRKIIIFTISALSLLMPQISAAEGGDPWYVGASFGTGKMDLNASEIDAAMVAIGFGTSSSTVDDKDTGFKVIIGHQLTDQIAIEGSYADLGEYSFTTTTTGPVGVLGSKVEITGFGLDLVGRLPIQEKLSLIVRAGLMVWDADVAAGAIVGGAAVVGTYSEDGTDLKLGAGAQYDFTDKVSMRAEYELYNELGDPDSTGETDLSLFSLGIILSF